MVGGRREYSGGLPASWQPQKKPALVAGFVKLWRSVRLMHPAFSPKSADTQR